MRVVSPGATNATYCLHLALARLARRQFYSLPKQKRVEYMSSIQRYLEVLCRPQRLEEGGLEASLVSVPSFGAHTPAVARIVGCREDYARAMYSEADRLVATLINITAIPRGSKRDSWNFDDSFEMNAALLERVAWNGDSMYWSYGPLYFYMLLDRIARATVDVKIAQSLTA